MAVPPQDKNFPDTIARVIEWQYTLFAQVPPKLHELLHPFYASSGVSDDSATTHPMSTTDETETKPDANLPGDVPIQKDEWEDKKAKRVVDKDRPGQYKEYSVARKFSSPLPPAPQPSQAFLSQAELLTKHAEVLAEVRTSTATGPEPTDDSTTDAFKEQLEAKKATEAKTDLKDAEVKDSNKKESGCKDEHSKSLTGDQTSCPGIKEKMRLDGESKPGRPIWPGKCKTTALSSRDGKAGRF